MKMQCIIPVRNHWKVTATCLASIFNSNIPFKYEIIIYDNNSDDLTSSFLKEVEKQGYPITIITNLQKNLGFVGAVNESLKICDSKYILLLNNDVILDKVCIKNLVEIIEKYPEFGILGGMQFDSQWHQLSPVKNFVRGEKSTINNHIIMSDVLPFNINSDFIKCDDIHMACAITPTSIIKKIGIDSIYGLGGYDQEDFCLQLLEMGYEIGICLKAKYIHTPATTSSDIFSEMQILLNKNREIFWSRWGEKLRQNKI